MLREALIFQAVQRSGRTLTAMTTQLLLIAGGGASGAVLRYLITLWMKPSPSFPWAIFVVNVSGCLLFGLLHGWCQSRGELWRLALLTGVLGGYTTFSTFGWDTMMLLQRGQVLSAALNVIASVTAGVFAVWLGMWLSGRAPQ
jgi:fluoride exporter